MEYRIDFDSRPADVVLTTEGTASLEGFERMIRELAGHARFRPGMTIVVDHTDLNLNALTNADIREIAGTTRDVAAALQSAFLVVVAPSMVGFGLSRMWQSMVDQLELEAWVAMSRAEADDRIRRRAAAPGSAT